MTRMSAENRKLHTEWRGKVLERDKHCQVCGINSTNWNKKLNSHHLIPKEFKEFRWDVSNGMILCVHHHTLGKFSAHKNPIWFALWLHEHNPDKYKELCKRINSLI